ncbi:reverse transcriptase domain-containing protein [Tanacetum coccineum]
MTGVPRSIAEHRLNIREGRLPERQKKKGQAPDRNKAINEEVLKLVEPRVANSGDQPQLHGKTCAGTIACNKKIEKILSSPSNCSGAKVARYHLETKNIYQRPNHSRFHRGKTRGRSFSHRHPDKGRNPKTMDLVHRWILLLKRIQSWINTQEPIRNGVHLRPMMGVKYISAKVRLLAGNGLYEAKEQSMIQYMEKSKILISGFKGFSIEQVLMSENKQADAISKNTSTSFAHLTKKVLVEMLKEKSINEKEIFVMIEEEGYTRMTPLKSFLEPWLRCIGRLQVDYVIREIHEGSCNMYSRPRSVVAKAIRSEYYWSKKHKDASPFPEAHVKVKFLIVVIDYFTKWVVAEPVATIPGNQVKKFVWDNIIFRFGLPREIVSDNKKQFMDNPFKDRREKLNIKQRHTILANLQNRRVEIIMPSLRCVEVNRVQNDESLLLNLDMLEEKQETALVQEAKSKAKMEKYCNAKVCGTSFKTSDYVYRNNDASHVEDTRKLGLKWEGPYEMVKALGKGAYNLGNRNEDILPQTWNV